MLRVSCAITFKCNSHSFEILFNKLDASSSRVASYANCSISSAISTPLSTLPEAAQSSAAFASPAASSSRLRISVRKILMAVSVIVRSMCVAPIAPTHTADLLIGVERKGRANRMSGPGGLQPTSKITLAPQERAKDLGRIGFDGADNVPINSTKSSLRSPPSYFATNDCGRFRRLASTA